MSWIANELQMRTYDPDTGNELFGEGSSSDGIRRFRIRGPEVDFAFTASLSEAPLTESEKMDLQLTDAIVWYVFGGSEFPESIKFLISESLIATQWGHGLNPKHDAVFVRFDRGSIFNA